MTLYALQNLTVEIAGNQLVQDVSLEVEAGQCTAIIGASGSGKSLTCLTPFGLNSGSAIGSMMLDGIDLSNATAAEMRSARSQLTGFVFQQPLTALTPHLTVGAQLREAGAQGGFAFTRSDMIQKLERVGLSRADEKLDQFPHRLSGGERQRVLIAAAIAHNPKLLIADEPTSALDAALRSEIMYLLDELRAERGLGMLLVSHDLASVEGHADQLIVMDRGSVVESGPVAEVIANPKQDYTRRLIAATPRLSEPAPVLPDTGETVLQTKDVCVAFPKSGWRRGKVSAIQKTNIEVCRGEALAIVGGSGSGKSTLGRAIAGIGSVTSGSILWEDETLPERHARSLAMRALIQPVFQDPVASLDPQWKVADIIAEPLKNLRPEMLKLDRRAKVQHVLTEIGLDEEYLDRSPTSLSGGQAQRVAIARAIVADPHMLVLDEATSALDPLVGAEILKLLAQLQVDKNLSIIFITHDIASARRLCHRVAVLDNGRIVEEGNMNDVLKNPQSEITKKLIAAS
ncbi:MAG: dipeptide ABC transporter ATP-binding protein [Parasphingorhabdus sp.]